MPRAKKPVPAGSVSDRERRRQQILRAATELFARKGLDDVTAGDIARRTRLSRPLIYFYFPDLRALYLEVVREGMGRLQQRFEQAVAGSGSGLDKIEAIGRAYAAFHREEPETFQLCSLFQANPAVAAGHGSVTAGLLEENRRLHGLCAAVVGQGVRDGSIRPDLGPVEVTSLVLWGCVHGLAQVGAVQAGSLQDFAGLTPAAFLDAGIRLLRRALANRV